MADNTVLNAASGGDTIATDDIAGVKHQRVKVEFGSNGSASDVSNTNPLPVDVQALTSLQRTLVQSVATAAGGSDDLDSGQITNGRTGQLLQLIVQSSVFFKAELQTVTNAVATTVAVFVGGPLDGVDHTPVVRTAFTIAHAAASGFDGFRVRVTNLDTSEAADIYVTFIYDEVV